MGGWARGAPGSPGETRPRRVCDGLGAPSFPTPPPPLPGAPANTLLARISVTAVLERVLVCSGGGGQELVALVELRCWGVELAGGSRACGCLVLTAWCSACQGGNSICLCLQVGFSFLAFLSFVCFKDSRRRLSQALFLPPPTSHWNPCLGALSLHSLLQHLASPPPPQGCWWWCSFPKNKIKALASEAQALVPGPSPIFAGGSQALPVPTPSLGLATTLGCVS